MRRLSNLPPLTPVIRNVYDIGASAYSAAYSTANCNSLFRDRRLGDQGRGISITYNFPCLTERCQGTSVVARKVSTSE